MEKVLLGTKDIAELMGVTQERAGQVIRAGLIPSLRIGRAVKVPRSEFDKFMTDGCAAEAARRKQGAGK